MILEIKLNYIWLATYSTLKSSTCDLLNMQKEIRFICYKKGGPFLDSMVKPEEIMGAGKEIQ